MLNHPSGEELLAQGAPSDRTLATGKPPKRDDPGPVKLGLTDEQKKERREKREKAAIRDAKQEQAGAIAARELKAAQVGVVRATLFDADDWRREHEARSQRMESTFSRLYKPQAGEYWQKNKKPPPKKPVKDSLPAYTQQLPAALSLAHPSSREPPELDDDADEEDEEHLLAPVTAQPSFDPMAEPTRFYKEFKGRVAELKTGVKDNPTDRPTQAALLPRVAEQAVADANRKSPPPPPPPQPPPKVDPPSWSMPGVVSLSATNPVLDEDFDVEPGLVYTDSAHYLADHGVNIPMWDELDGELAALDAAHETAMKALAIRPSSSINASSSGLDSADMKQGSLTSRR